MPNSAKRSCPGNGKADGKTGNRRSWSVKIKRILGFELAAWLVTFFSRPTELFPAVLAESPATVVATTPEDKAIKFRRDIFCFKRIVSPHMVSNWYTAQMTEAT